ncbi:MAG: hypothetical protein ND866_18715 [Pyrinomonadaceae bacterium]|nr:hypothetical protein [Pyrinomonadaceae bacterium]
MSFKVQVRRAAELDVAGAQVWYETQRDGLGVAFHSEISKVFSVPTDEVSAFHLLPQQLNLLFR